jgi:hypothetical protein
MLVDALRRLKHFLSDAAMEMLEAANGIRLVEVENRMYPSYCYAIFHLGVMFYFNFLAGEWKWRTSGVALIPVEINGELRLQCEIGLDPEKFNIRAIDEAVIVGHWGTISKTIAHHPLVRNHLTLGNQLVFEKKRLLQPNGEDSNYQPAINLWREKFVTYINNFEHFCVILRRFACENLARIACWSMWAISSAA